MTTTKAPTAYPVDVIASAMFVETNGGELEPIADVYTPRGCALYIIDRLKKAGWTITHPDPF